LKKKALFTFLAIIILFFVIAIVYTIGIEPSRNDLNTPIVEITENTPVVDMEYLSKEEIIEVFYSNYSAFSEVADYILDTDGLFFCGGSLEELVIENSLKDGKVMLDIKNMEIGDPLIEIINDLGFISIQEHQTEPTVYFNAPSDIGMQGVAYARDGLANNNDITHLEKDNWYYYSLRFD